MRLRWRAGDGGRYYLRATRGAELMTIIFANRSVQMGLGIYPSQTLTEARRLMDAKQP
jgi:hypothetical protein